MEIMNKTCRIQTIMPLNDYVVSLTEWTVENNVVHLFLDYRYRRKGLIWVRPTVGLYSKLCGTFPGLEKKGTSIVQPVLSWTQLRYMEDTLMT